MSVRVSSVVLFAQPADKKLPAGLPRGETSSCAWSLCYFSSCALDVVAGARLLAGKVKSFLKPCWQGLCSFDNSVMPPRQIKSIQLREQPGWITFRLDGKHAWPSTGEIIEVKSKRIIKALVDETGRAIHSEKIVQIDFAGGKALPTGYQFGLGRRP
jgi:hypothetical protein